MKKYRIVRYPNHASIERLDTWRILWIWPVEVWNAIRTYWTPAADEALATDFKFYCEHGDSFVEKECPALLPNVDFDRPINVPDEWVDWPGKAEGKPKSPIIWNDR